MNTDNPYRSGKPIMNIFNLFRSKNVRRYGHIQSLGYNCKPSFQFFQQYRFVESGLFSWTNNTNISTLTRALKDFDRIGTGEWEAVPPMWKDLNSSVFFHGRTQMTDTTDIETLNADKADLTTRTAYLKEKFKTIGRDGKKNLYIYKYSIHDETDENVFCRQVTELYETLKQQIKNEFDLLIVLQKSTFAELTESKFANGHIFIRRVDFFTPENKVTDKKNDRKAWKKIFKEFAPAFKLKKTKKYKFEED